MAACIELDIYPFWHKAAIAEVELAAEDDEVNSRLPPRYPRGDAGEKYQTARLPRRCATGKSANPVLMQRAVRTCNQSNL